MLEILVSRKKLLEHSLVLGSMWDLYMVGHVLKIHALHMTVLNWVIKWCLCLLQCSYVWLIRWIQNVPDLIWNFILFLARDQQFTWWLPFGQPSHDYLMKFLVYLLMMEVYIFLLVSIIFERKHKQEDIGNFMLLITCWWYCVLREVVYSTPFQTICVAWLSGAS